MSLADALGLSGAKALARALGPEKLRALAFDEDIARAIEQAGHISLLGKLDGGRIEHDGVLDAICLGALPDDAAVLRECARALPPGGRVLLATGMASARKERHLVMAQLLHAGLVELEQRWSRGIYLDGRVRSRSAPTRPRARCPPDRRSESAGHPETRRCRG